MHIYHFFPWTGKIVNLGCTKTGQNNYRFQLIAFKLTVHNVFKFVLVYLIIMTLYLNVLQESVWNRGKFGTPYSILIRFILKSQFTHVNPQLKLRLHYTTPSSQAMSSKCIV